MSNWRLFAFLVSLAAFFTGLVLLVITKSSDPTSSMKLAGFITFVIGAGGVFSNGYAWSDPEDEDV